MPYFACQRTAYLPPLVLSPPNAPAFLTPFRNPSAQLPGFTPCLRAYGATPAASFCNAQRIPFAADGALTPPRGGNGRFSLWMT